MKRAHVILLLVVAALAAAYAHRLVHEAGGTAGGGEPTLVQCPLSSLTPSLLLQRQPILVYERIVSPETALPSTVFRWLHWPFARRRSTIRCGDVDHLRSRGRFTLVWKRGDAEGEGTRAQLRISDPRDKVGIDLVTSCGQVLVLPRGWRCACVSPGDTLEVLELH